MSKAIYMLDTNICSFLICKKPEYLLDKLQKVVFSSITYAEFTFGAINKKASPKIPGVVSEFVDRLDDVLAWNKSG